MHIVMLPLPLQSHINPCLAIARLLIPQGFSFTFVVTEELAPKLTSTSVPNQSGIQYAAIPCNPIPSYALDFSSILKIIDSMRLGFETLLQKLAASAPGVSCIIADCFVLWSLQVASQFNIPAFALFTTNAHTFAAMLHTDVLIAKGLTPVTDPQRIIDCIPGFPPMQVGNLPISIRMYPSIVLDLVRDIHKAAGVILNTVYELEKGPLEVIKNQVPIYSVGPMLLMLGSQASRAGETVCLWPEQRDCLKWLDSRPAASVLFVAFGSLASVGQDQIRELAEGLEASEQAFLWVIRADAIDGSLSNVLPEDFKERTNDRGLIISWAPQVEVLSHPAVGGFLTHCGWNSLTENFSMGCVPMICWPQLAEQRLNARLLVDEWKVGIELREVDGVVKSAAVEKAVTQLMLGDVGREIRRRAMELQKTVSSAVQEGGTSHNHLKALGQEIKRLGSIA